MDSEDYFVSDFIPVKSSTSYIGTLTGNAVLEYTSLTSAGTRDSTKKVPNGFITNSTTNYIRINGTISNMNDIMLVEGSTVPSEYHPYYEWVEE